MNKHLASLFVSIGLASGVPAAFAQSADPAADAAGAPAGQVARQFDQRAFRMPSERVEARLAYIRTALKITAAQQPQFDAYADVRRKQAAAMDKRFQERRAQMEKVRAQADKAPTARTRPTAVERHERQRDRMVHTTQRLNELLAVEKPLYAALSPDQQRVADEVLASRGRAHGGPGRFQHRTGFGRG
jgi:hypothetical protein